MLDVFAVPRQLTAVARRVLVSTLEAVEAVPKIAAALDDIRATLKHSERLATFAAGELPEIVYQLEEIKTRLEKLETARARPEQMS
ncbi:hypothetical protein DL991_32215 [Amycolatopsis sp. WAC 01375]|uniref:hypothetical protein n=1 Tax=unclassified Amycolatopsis TaxID=2618356 RepID=UPI000F769C1F|nr:MULTISPECIES: hypothetical protein [unclassified Amycolatopsis]RSM73388.1 hypothetical protein DL991_32215 [Amycolatopsis sp. WAC 01375]RSN22800.1 hypothetical protein DL990_37085 [Amycolatopsis sp. WAC 01416]